MAAIEYKRPESLEHAVELLATYGDDAKVLAGGQSLIPAISLGLARPSVLIDIGRLTELKGTDLQVDTAVVRSLVRHQEFVRPPIALAQALPLVAAAAPYIGSVAIRNRGTFGGSVVHGDPASEFAAVAVGLGGVLLARSQRGDRRITLDDFYLGFLATSLEADELIIQTELPIAQQGTGASIKELAFRAGDYAIAAVGVQVRLDAGGGIADANVAAFGISDRPIRFRDAELAICREGASGVAAAVSAIESSVDADDTFASRTYRQRIVGVLFRRALDEALVRARAEL